MMHPFLVTALMALALATGGGDPARAEMSGEFGSVIRIPREAFGPDAGEITFDELPRGSRNPIYAPPTYGAPEGGVIVGFGGFFEGQAIGTAATCPPGAALTGCVIGTPLAPLRLAQTAPATQIRQDGANPHSPSLSGTPVFNGPVTMIFDRDVAGVGLAGGYFDTPQSTAIQAFDRQGRLIGGVRNLGTGMEYLALVTGDGSDRIAGVQFSLVGAEGAGFAIDDLSFGKSSQILRENVAELAAQEAQKRTPGLEAGIQLSQPQRN
ncbi:PEP-CTERM sorting domain-containing protein [Rhodobacter capsulatus]|uniref:hypothetical protein n=1 Tax=Rhodobacter capsulatus TaxID=1061 RepID=UPI0003D35E7E|nr:hypothetical protein [Rhodobacter capsulatus]ETD89855.1 hypothetical protein U713_07635 [Rhodobacter capsulatus YW2]